MPRTLSHELASEWGPDFTRGVGVSAILHLAIAALIVWAATRAPAPPPPMTAYTVELTDPAALGGRLAFGPLDRPLGRPRRIAEPAGGAPADVPSPGEPAAAETVKPPSGVESPKAVAPAKVAEAPKPVEAEKPADEVIPVAPPKPITPPTPQPASVPKAAPVEPPKPVVAPKPPQPPEAEVSLSRKTKPQEQPPPPEQTPRSKVEPKPEPKPPPRAEPPPEAQAQARASAPTTVPTPTTAPPAAAPEQTPADVREAPQAKIGTAGPVTAHPVPAPPKAATPRMDTAKATRKSDGAADGARIVPAKPLSPLPHPDAGAVAKPAPDVAARGDGGAGSGGSAETPAHDEYAAAAERWRSRMAGGMGGMDGAANQRGTVGDGTNAAGGGGTVVGFEYLSYRQRITNLIKRNWANALRQAGLVAVVRFELAADGTVSGVQLLTSSGDKAYDQSVVRAVQRSSPLPPPPERYREEFREVDVDFHSEELGGQGAG